MKKTFLISLSIAVVAIAMFSSCKKENGVVSFKATISDFNSYNKSTKTHIEVLTPENGDPEYWVNWNHGDKVMINGNEYNVALNGSNASIAGVTENDEQNGGYYAFYPANRAKSNGDNVAGWPTQILLPQVQNYTVENGKQVVEAPIAAYCSNSQSSLALNFKNLCSLLKIEMPSNFDPINQEVAYITVSSSNTPLWGIANITGTTEPELSAPEITSLLATDNTSLSATDNTVTLDFTQNGLSGSTGSGSGSSSSGATGVHSSGPFYIVLPAATNVQALTIRIYIFDGTNSSNRRTVLRYEKVGSNAVSILPNSIYGTGNLPTTTTTVDDVPYPNLGTGEFTVGATRTGGTLLNPTYSYKKVRFALGNLQYQASTGTWRFAPHQWTAIGNTLSNSNPSSTQSDWIDLFGYGTSGAHYMPYTTSYNRNSNTGSYAQSNIQYSENDWGANPIVNGGNQPNKWRTLSQSEWYYLFNFRDHSDILHYTNCSVGGVKGMIFLPDNFPTQRRFLRDELASPYNDWDWQSLDNDQWNTVAAMGAVFMPVTGYRTNTTINQTNYGYYWSGTINSSYNNNPYCLRFDSNGETSDCSSFTNTNGMAVRLVRDVN